MEKSKREKAVEQELSIELLADILSRLDAQWLYSARCVCREWHDVASSLGFASLWNRNLDDKDVWAVLTHVKTNERMVWYPFSKYKNIHTFKPLAGPPRTWKWCKSRVPYKRFSTAGTFQGLVVGTIDNTTLAVGNPLTGNWKILPPTPLRASWQARDCFLWGDMETGPYNVVAFICHGSHYEAIEYSSASHSWSLTQMPEDGGVVGLKGSMTMVQRQERLVTYDMEHKTWSHVIFNDHLTYEMEQEEKCNVMTIGSFYYKGTFMLAKVIYKRNGNLTAYGLGIWALKEHNRAWEVLCRKTFRELYGEEGGKGVLNWEVSLQGDVLVLSPVRSLTARPVAYHLKKALWECFPRPRFVCNYVFAPSFTAKPCD